MRRPARAAATIGFAALCGCTAGDDGLRVYQVSDVRLPAGARLHVVELFNPEGVHVTTGDLEVAYAAPGRPFGRARRLGTGSTRGGPPSWRIRTDLLGQPLLEVLSGDINRGCMSGILDLFRFADGQAIDIATLRTGVVWEENGQDTRVALAPDGPNGFKAVFTGTLPGVQHFRRRWGHAYLPDRPRPEEEDMC